MSCYIAINFHSHDKVAEGVRKLCEAGYLFTNNRSGEFKAQRMTDFHQIINRMGVTPVSILLGDTACKMEWRIYERNTFYDDRNISVMTVDEFLAFNKDFEPERYKRAYGC